MADRTNMNAILNDIPRYGDIPGFSRDDYGKPIIGLDSESLFACGDLIRRTEQLILDQFGRGLVSGTTHTCLGQELAAMSVVRALDHPQDVVLSNHRNHGHFLTYSGDFVGLVAEIMGRHAGVCGGRGGSQHLAYRHFHSNGVQGGMTGIGAGLALARKLKAEGGIVAAIIGDGTLGQGLLYESMNLAAVWQAPLLIVVENNGIAQTTYTRDTLGGSIEGRGAAFGLPVWRYSDEDPEFCTKVQAVIDEVRRAVRPGFLILDTRRMGPHSKGDDLRDPDELAAIRSRDPLAAMGRRLSEQGRKAIETRNAAFIESVRMAADASPEAGYDEPPRHIYTVAPVEAGRSGYPPDKAGRSVRQSLNEALRHLLETSERTILLGEDLHDPYGGAFKVTQGLSTDFPGRVISTPISEAGITGTTIGLAVAGFHPVMEVMFADFLTLCMDQIYNHAVKFPGVFPEMAVPIVIRTPSGGRRGYGPTHSQSPENIFTSVPGLTVVYGSHRHDVGRLLIDAVQRWPYPVLFLEHKLLYGETQDRADYEVLPRDADDVAGHLFPTLIRRRDDGDVTVLCYGGMLPVVEKAAGQLEAEEELEVELIVPSLLSPLPSHLIDRLAASPRVVIAEESHHDFGIGAEIAARLLEAGYRGKLVRVGTPPVPIASARSLERHLLPDEATLVDEILDLF
jgi:2-oxoisovalerate dehydrogenase E1 component